MGYSEVMHFEGVLSDELKLHNIADPLRRLMDIVGGSTPTTLHWFGIIWRDNEYHYKPDKDTVENCSNYPAKSSRTA